VWTGEEKGLLGSRYYVAHPTISKEKFVANVNLDQLRPIFPLKTLTTLAIDDSTMGNTVRQVAAGMNIRIQPDPEPGRNLLRRSDHWNFMQIGVPAVGFIFGYELSSPEEAQSTAVGTRNGITAPKTIWSNPGIPPPSSTISSTDWWKPWPTRRNGPTGNPAVPTLLARRPPKITTGSYYLYIMETQREGARHL
jgi:Zn-dependent M28 family amino/carboxypeptidase